MKKCELILPDYDDCLTNISSSILHRFGIDDEHKTLQDVDVILKKYKKIVFVLFDGLGSYILDKNLSQESFLIKNKLRDYSSVFPPTTASATTAFLSTLNANESGWLGWHMYFEEINKDLIMFTNTGYYNEEINEPNYTTLNYGYKNIVTKINEKGYRTNLIYSFNGYETLDKFIDEIKNFTDKKEEGFMYAYFTEPDSLMHKFGTQSNEAKSIIKEINEKMEQLSYNIDNDTLLIVSADHGQLDVEYLNLYLDEDIKNNLVVNPYCDSRTVMFKVKDKEKFKKDFKHKYGGIFDLYTKEEIVKNKLFGNLNDSDLFLKNLGDFIAIGKSNYYIDFSITNEQRFKGTHSGITKEEMIIPLILIHR